MNATCQRCWEDFKVGATGGFFLGYGNELIEVAPKGLWDADRKRRKLDAESLRAFGNYIMKCYECLQGTKNLPVQAKKPRKVK